MLEDYNPWWDNSSDYIYDTWKNNPIRWIPDIIRSFTLQPFSLHFLVGPRQVGKSTALRIYLHQLIRDGMSPSAICYLPCDKIFDFRELQTKILQFINSNHDDTSLLILDEITFVNDWWRAMKDAIDRGLLLNTVVYITGSASMEILKQKEYFPGRRGDGNDYVLNPLDFNEYSRHIGELSPDNRDITKLSIMNYLKSKQLQSKKIKNLFDQYLITGGFPHAIMEYVIKGEVSHRSYSIYIDWIRNDLVRLGKNEGYLKEILNSILSSGSSPVSYTGIAKNTSINTAHTVNSYVQLLSDIFVLNILQFRYADGRVGPKKNRKIHISDPFLYDALSYYTKSSSNVADKVEAVVASHLARISDVYYWRGQSSEVDVIAILKTATLGVEVKWSDRIRKRPRYHESGSEIITLNKTDIALFLSNHLWK